jgi:hypothetical protein
MSRKKLIESASAHPEILAIGLEVTLYPSRRRYYSPLVLMLADAAVQEIVRIVAAKSPPSDAAGDDIGPGD